MCTANKTIETAVENYLMTKAMIDELNEELDRIKNEITGFMDSVDADEMISGTHMVKWTEVLSVRVDTTALKKLLGAEALAPYTKNVSSHRFSVK